LRSDAYVYKKYSASYHAHIKQLLAFSEVPWWFFELRHLERDLRVVRHNNYCSRILLSEIPMESITSEADQRETSETLL